MPICRPHDFTLVLWGLLSPRTRDNCGGGLCNHAAFLFSGATKPCVNASNYNQHHDNDDYRQPHWHFAPHFYRLPDKNSRRNFSWRIVVDGSAIVHSIWAIATIPCKSQSATTMFGANVHGSEPLSMSVSKDQNCPTQVARPVVLLCLICHCCHI